MHVRILCLVLIGLCLVACSGEKIKDPLVDVRSHHMGVEDRDSFVWQSVTSDRPAAPELIPSANVLEMRLAGFYLGSKRVDGTDYSRVMIPGHGPLTVAGYPELPRVRANVIIPHQARVDFEVIDTEQFQIPMAAPLPSRGDITRNVDPARVPYQPAEFYRSSTRYPLVEALAEEPFVMRDYRGLTIQFQPFQYDRASKKLVVYTRIRVRFISGDQVRMDSGRRESAEFANLYRSTFVNYSNSTRYDPIAEPGRLIFITADAYYDAVLPLRDWKIERGLQASVVRLSQIGSSAADIKAFIQTEYNRPGSLTYVILVGDSDTVPTLQGGHEGAHSDPTYVMVEGDDYYADLFISRISARNQTQVRTQVAKFIGYERDPDPQAGWYTRGIGIASDEGSPTDYQRADDLRDSLLGYGFSQVAQIYDPGASASQVSAAVNQGASIINYIGHGSGTSWVTSSMNTANVSALSNRDMLPFVIDVSCLNGSFVNHDTCFAESWLRAGTPDEPAGAVAMFSASTNASWVPPCVMQTWIVDELLVKELRYTAGGVYFGGAMKVLDQYGNSEGRKLVEQYNIFGDATLMMRTKTPRRIQVQHPDSLADSGALSVTVKYQDGSPLAGATVALSNGQVIATGQTSSSGSATLSYGQIDTGSATFVVTAHNVVTYRTSLPVGGGGNNPPVADAGADQVVVEGVLVGLDGSSSYDPDGDAIAYTWTQTGGPGVQLSNSTAAQPTFSAPAVSAATSLSFSLVVTDGDLDSPADSVTVIVQNQATNKAPVADAGVDQTVLAGAQVALDGLDSFDPDGDNLTFSWSQIAGPAVQLSSATAVQPGFTAPAVTSQATLTFELSVNDGLLDSLADQVHVTVNPDASGWDLVAAATDTPISIPDNNSTGIESQLTLNAGQAIAEMEVEVAITHTYIGDLRVRLMCPDGNLVTLHDRSGGSANDIYLTYPVSGCDGQMADGTIKLLVSDHARVDIGALDYWEVRINFSGPPPGWDVDLPSADTPISIPDNNTSGIVSSLQSGVSGSIVAMEVVVDIDHTWIGDLEVLVECPGGGSATLHDNSGGSADDIHQTYQVSACNGQTSNGTFRLKVSDHARYDLGSLENWRLRLQVD